MINNVTVKNYQSLKDVDVDLGGFTVIVGESNVGKSAFIRAIKALVNNESGRSFITKGKRTTTVEASFDDGLVALWSKDTSAEYYLGGKRFGKMGTNVPDAVADALRLGTIDLGGGIKFAPNFHDQFSTPFLTDESASRIAKILGELSGVNILYKAISEANLRVKRNNTKLTTYRQDLIEKKKQIKQFVGLKAKGQVLSEVRSLLEKAERAVDSAEKLVDIIDRLDSYSSKFVSCSTLVSQLEGVKEINLDQVADIIDKIDVLSVTIGKVESFEDKQQQAQDVAGNAETEFVLAGDVFNVFKETLEVCPLCERPMEEDECS